MINYNIFLYSSAVLIAFFCGCIGLKIIVSKRPLIVSSKVHFYCVLAVFMPFIIQVVISISANKAIPIVELILLMLLAMAGWYGCIFTGYTVIYGITNPAFRDSLIAVFQKMGIEFEEDKAGVTTIPSEGIRIEAKVRRIGMVKLRNKGKSHTEWSKRLEMALREYYAVNTVKMTYTQPVLLCLWCSIGVLVMAAIH